jgi:hypothetical protein
MTQKGNKLEEEHLSEESRRKAEEIRKNIYRSMTAEEKLGIATELYFSAMNLKKAHLKRLHPKWTEQEIEQRAREWMLYAKT